MDAWRGELWVLARWPGRALASATHPALGDGTLEWIDAGPDVVAFRREPGSECWINLGADPVPMPQGQVLVASAEAHAGTIPTDVAVWLQIG